MIPSLKAEIRKIWTVRSTYGVLLFCLFIMCIYAFWVEGVKAGDVSKAGSDPYKVASLIRDATWNLAFFGGLVGILSMTYEYRYNTIMYTLTSSRRRGQILLSKIAAVSIFSVFFTIFVAVLVPLLMLLGFWVSDISLSGQIFPTDLWWRLFFVSWGYSMLGLLLATFIRHQIGAIIAYFAIPAFAEPMIGLLLKDDKAYLPYVALQQASGSSDGLEIMQVLSHGKAALVFIVYLVVGWIIAWYLFLRRDAA